jgi:Ca2+-binding RTX toxin-like protein
MGGKSGIAVLLGGALLLAAFALPGVGQASVVVFGGTYLGESGEVNRITVDKHASDFSYTDPGASSIDVSNSTSCTVAGDQVTCPWDSPGLSFEVYSGDQDDTITNTQPGYPYIELQGGPGDDTITANAFLPAVGGPGNDHLVGGPGNDWFLGGPGRFDPKGPAALPDNDTIEGNGGGDGVHGDLGDDVIDGGEGGDSIEGDDGNDVLHGGPGDDFLDGGGICCAPIDAGSDLLDGGDGDDRMAGSRDGAPDIFSCGPGTDMAEVGLGDQVASDCEEIDQFVSCPGSGGCSVEMVVTAPPPPARAASAAASKRHGRRVVLGAKRTKLNSRASKALSIRLKRGRLAKVLRGDGKARAVLEVKVLKKKRKANRIDRTPFALRR